MIYRVDDAFAKYFVKKVLDEYKSIGERDYDKKIEFKKEVMIESLLLLKVTKIGIKEYKNNCDVLVPFLVKEIEENFNILNDMKSLAFDNDNAGT